MSKSPTLESNREITRESICTQAMAAVDRLWSGLDINNVTPSLDTKERELSEANSEIQHLREILQSLQISLEQKTMECCDQEMRITVMNTEIANIPQEMKDSKPRDGAWRKFRDELSVIRKERDELTSSIDILQNKYETEIQALTTESGIQSLIDMYYGKAMRGSKASRSMEMDGNVHMTAIAELNRIKNVHMAAIDLLQKKHQSEMKALTRERDVAIQQRKEISKSTKVALSRISDEHQTLMQITDTEIAKMQQQIKKLKMQTMGQAEQARKLKGLVDGVTGKSRRQSQEMQREMTEALNAFNKKQYELQRKVKEKEAEIVTQQQTMEGLETAMAAKQDVLHRANQTVDWVEGQVKQLLELQMEFARQNEANLGLNHHLRYPEFEEGEECDYTVELLVTRGTLSIDVCVSDP